MLNDVVACTHATAECANVWHWTETAADEGGANKIIFFFVRIKDAVLVKSTSSKHFEKL
jgi:hypothetical protein